MPTLRAAPAPPTDADADAAPDIARPHHAAFCFDTLAAHYDGGREPEATFEEAHCPLFVTWNKAARLRGCIGSLDAHPLRSGLARYALASALADGRFAPIARREVPALSCTVSLLSSFEAADHVHDWTPGVHGIVLRWDGLSATYLPHVAAEQGWTRAQAVDALFAKGGHAGPVTDAMRREASVTRYRATTASMDHAAWARRRAGGVGGGSA